MNYLYISRVFLQLSSVIVILFIIFSLNKTSKIRYTKPPKILSDSEISFMQKLLIGESTEHVVSEITEIIPVHDSIACYFSTENALSDLTAKNLSSSKSIFFFDTSCQSSTNAKIVIEPFQACAIESAALTNVDYDVYVLYLSDGLIKGNVSVSDTLLNALTEYENVQVLHLDFTKLADSMLMSNLHFNTSYQSYDNLRTVIKYLVLKKYGGIYLDTDVMVIKSFKGLPPNFIGTSINYSISNSVIGWRRIRRSTSNTTMISNLTYTLHDLICNKRTSRCNDFSIFSKDMFSPIDETNWRQLYQTNEDTSKLKNTLKKKSYTVKTYDNLRKGLNFSFDSETLFNWLSMKYCPKVFDILTKTTKDNVKK